MRAATWGTATLLLGMCEVGCGGQDAAAISVQEVTLDVLAFNAGPGTGGNGAGGAAADAAAGAATADYAITKALISVKGMTLSPCTSDTDAIDIPPRVYDLLHQPSLGETVTTAVSEYCSLRVDFAPVAEETDGMPKGEAFYVKGQNDDTDGLENAWSFTFSRDDGSSFGDSPLILGVDLLDWRQFFSPPPGSLPGLSPEVMAALYVDANGNQALDADEQPPIALAVRAR